MNSQREAIRRLIHQTAGSARTTTRDNGTSEVVFDIEALERCFRWVSSPERLVNFSAAASDEMVERIYAMDAEAARGALILKERIEANRQRRYREGPNGLEYIEV